MITANLVSWSFRVQSLFYPLHKMQKFIKLISDAKDRHFSRGIESLFLLISIHFTISRFIRKESATYFRCSQAFSWI